MKSNKKIRLDVFLIDKNFFNTRNKAQANIMAGNVLVNTQAQYSPGYYVKQNDQITIKEAKCPYVSRGGLKLEYALKYFNINLKNKICADIGVATGGFSDCILKHNAKKVYGIDVGKGQIDDKILQNKHFIFMPNTNARYLSSNDFDTSFDFAAIDVSFISVKLILQPLLNCMSDKFQIICLIKPQFELTPKLLSKGIVKTQESRDLAINEIVSFFNNNLSNKHNCKNGGITESPIKGSKGNIEYLFYICSN